MTHDEDLLPSGTLLASRYRLIRLIGQGGMGQVYQAEQVGLGRAVAVKLLRPHVAGLPGARARFQREAKVAAALQHPGAMAVHDFGEDQGRLFIVMELLRGATLRHELRHRTPLRPLERALEVAREVADVLVAAHRIGLIHRDLKPENIFLVEDQGGSQRVVVADFGLAFIQDREGTDRFTREGIVSGTPAYLSPEQAMGRPLGLETDLYSLGCTLYEMLTGEAPFRGDSELNVLNQHLFATPPSPRSQRDRDEEPLSYRLDELVLRMLAKLPHERSGARAARDELDEIIATLGQPERSRGDRLLAPREERAVIERPGDLGTSTITPSSGREVEVERPVRRLVVIGELDGDLSLGLKARGWQLDQTAEAPDGSEVREAHALYAPGAAPEELAELRERAIPIVTDTEASDLDRISKLIRAGVAEVVPRPVQVEELCRRLDRILRKGRKTRGSR